MKVDCFLVGNGTKWAENADIWPKMTKNAYFGPNLAVFGPKILIFMGVSKSFGTNITENHLDNLSALFFGQALDQIGQKCRYLDNQRRCNLICEVGCKMGGDAKHSMLARCSAKRGVLSFTQLDIS